MNSQTREYNMAYKSRNREKIAAQGRNWYLNNKDRHDATTRASKLRRYGLTQEQYDHKLDLQNGGCAFCGVTPTSRRLDIDHDHGCCSGDTSCGKCVRWLLCRACNRALGAFKDNIETMSNACTLMTEWRLNHG